MTPKSPDQKTALFAGTFDPFTIGHQSIVDRGLQLFDRIVIAIGENHGKKNLLSVEQRIEAIREIYRHDPRVEVCAYSGLTTDAAASRGAKWLLRGARTVADFEYERTLADINRNIAGIETVILYTLPELASVSSSMVRELMLYGRDVERYLPTKP